MCEHESFECLSKVARLTDVDGGPVTGYSADIIIRCAKCKTPFRFLGLPCGYITRGAATNVDGTELRAAIEPGPVVQ